MPKTTRRSKRMTAEQRQSEENKIIMLALIWVMEQMPLRSPQTANFEYSTLVRNRLTELTGGGIKRR